MIDLTEIWRHWLRWRSVLAMTAFLAALINTFFDHNLDHLKVLFYYFVLVVVSLSPLVFVDVRRIKKK